MKPLILFVFLLISTVGSAGEALRSSASIQTKEGVLLVYRRGESFSKPSGSAWATISRLESGTRIKIRQPHFILSTTDDHAKSIYLVRLSGDLDYFSRYTYFDKVDARLPDRGNLIEVDRKKLGEGRWELTPTEKLRTGEYALCGLGLISSPGAGKAQPRGPQEVVETDHAFFEGIGGDFWDFGIDN